jgi:superfamily I DNA and/or RNA helicase
VTDPAIAALLPESIATRLEEAIKVRCTSLLAQHELGPELRKLILAWREDVSSLIPEIVDRVRRGANVVFCTCGTATERNVGVTAGMGEYDWVLIEEAAKAWPTELLLPLVRGMTWTLIGDHRQLPAYRRREVTSLLDECADGDEALRVHHRRRESYIRTFKLFESFFPKPGATPSPRDSSRLREESGLINSPVNTLTRQFRMAPAISALVSRFYTEPLNDGDGTDEPHDIPFFAGWSVVWIDTGDEIEHRSVPCWHNKGEIEVMSRLLDGIRPLAGRDTEAEREHRLAILSPYREQVDWLATSLDALYAPRVHTIDSFQGREAEIVCVSLVRRRGGHQGHSLSSRFGHVVDPQRTNVMLSRARRLLILIGDQQHFAIAHEENNRERSFWPDICQAVHDRGLSITSAALRHRLKERTPYGR